MLQKRDRIQWHMGIEVLGAMETVPGRQFQHFCRQVYCVTQPFKLTKSPEHCTTLNKILPDPLLTLVAFSQYVLNLWTFLTSKRLGPSSLC